MLENQILVVQSPFQWEGMIQWIKEHTLSLQTSCKVMPKIKTIALEKPLELQKNTIGRQKHKKTVKKQSIGGVNNECIVAIRSG